MRRSLRNAGRLALVACLAAALHAPSGALQDPGSAEPGRDAPAVLAAFAEPAQSASPAIATLFGEGRPLALATVVDGEGLVVSKASELEGELTCRLADGRRVPARVVARDLNFDLALVQVEARELTPVRWNREPAAVGRLVVTPGSGREVLAVGIVGVAPKLVAGGSGRLGVVLSFETEGAVIARVSPESPAAVAGLAPGDRILAVDDAPVPDRHEATRLLGQRAAGERVRLRLRRGDRTIELTPTLAVRTRRGRGRSSGVQGEQSALRAGFPSALQHDGVLRPRECGGPLVGLDGSVVALNIARAGRVATYAIPAAEVERIVARLREGTADGDPR